MLTKEELEVVEKMESGKRLWIVDGLDSGAIGGEIGNPIRLETIRSLVRKGVIEDLSEIIRYRLTVDFSNKRLQEKRNDKA